MKMSGRLPWIELYYYLLNENMVIFFWHCKVMFLYIHAFCYKKNSAQLACKDLLYVENFENVLFCLKGVECVKENVYI